MPEAKANGFVVRPAASSDDDAHKDQAYDSNNLEREVSEIVFDTYFLRTLMEQNQNSISPKTRVPPKLTAHYEPSSASTQSFIHSLLHTTTMSMSPTHIALLQIPAVQVESG